ncbi:MAG: ABC transporter permease [Methanomassiliicoccus sp.]|nr:ABC transporter permease [Methanomassiliicoccus sp.]
MTSNQTPGRSERSLFGLKRGQGSDYLLYIISLVGFIAVWWLGAIILNKAYLPAPPEVLEAFIKAFDQDPATNLPMMQQVFASLRRFAVGFALALLIAVPMGLAMGFSRIFEGLGRPIVEVLRPIPPIAWVPLFFIAFGLFFGPVMTIFLGAFFPILSNVMFGVKSVEPALIDAAKTLGASKWKIFTKVVFPSTIPYMMAGVTIGLGIGWMCIVAAEMIGAQGGGVGAIILRNGDIGLYEYMFAGMLMIAILGLLTTWLSKFIEGRVSKWMGMR